MTFTDRPTLFICIDLLQEPTSRTGHDAPDALAAVACHRARDGLVHVCDGETYRGESESSFILFFFFFYYTVITKPRCVIRRRVPCLRDHHLRFPFSVLFSFSFVFG